MSNEVKHSEGRFYEDFIVVLFSIVNTDFLLDVQKFLQSILPKRIRLSLITKGFICEILSNTSFFKSYFNIKCQVLSFCPETIC